MATCPFRLAPLLLAVACATRPPPAPAPDHDESAGLELQVVSPRPEASVRNTAGLVEVTGRVGRDWLLHADVVLAIDLSNSAFLASGIDLDGDGTKGATHHFAEAGKHKDRPWRSWTSDPDDVIALVELEAARNLVRSLDAAETRIGALTYTSEVRVRAPLGSPLNALSAVDEINVERYQVDFKGTDIARALRESRELFLAAPHLDGPDRPRVVFLLSDGKPTVYPGALGHKSERHWAARAAIREAQELTERKIAVCVLGFGEDIVSPEPEQEEVAFLDELARSTGCVHIPVDDPDLLRIDRTPRFERPSELALQNLTTGSPGRALRVLETGLFDGFVELAPGENTIEVSALLPDGRRLVERRVVHYEPAEAQTDAEREATARLLLRLRERARQLGEDGAQDAPPPPVGAD